ncbi:MAG: ankyrin repeat domain-containing protein [Cyanobacteria bacterium]|nr:ankyrin repeat domain-containing protein [Cyanobacteriota bacterium]
MTPLALAAREGHLNIIEKLLTHLDLDINAKDHDGRTALSWALLKGHSNVVACLLAEPGIDFNGKDDRGYTPLAWASVKGDEKNLMQLLACPNIQFNAKDKQGNTPLALASLYGHEKIVALLLAKTTIDINAKNDNEGYTALALASLYGHDRIVDKLLAHPQLEAGVAERKFMKSMVQLMKNFNSQDPQNPGSLGFVSILPDLLLNHSISWMNTLFNRIESAYDNHPSMREYHPNEAELLLLIKHPELMERNPEKIGSLTRCLTSISHFVDVAARLSDQTLKCWGDIGFLTHGFRFWRYDTVGGADSLLAQFGFEPAPETRPLNDVFGKGFLYQRPTSRTLIEFRRGYLLVTNPERGTLVIRNSSPAFGRDLLKHPAYYLKKQMSREQVLAFDPRTLADQDSLLYRRHYPNQINSSHESSQGIVFLTNALLEINTQYRNYKLDTEAFHQGHFKGHLSPGLPKLVKVLTMFQAKGLTLPDLAFTQSEFPPYQPYFYDDLDMKKTDRFPMTPAHLKELTDFVNGAWTERKYPESDWIRFLQQAGVENRGELVMLEPETVQEI